MESAIKKYITIAGMISISLIGLFHWWFQGVWWMTGIYIGLTCLATASIFVSYHIFGYQQADDVNWLIERESAEYNEIVQRLEKTKLELDELEITEGVVQANILLDLINDYHSVVETRFIGKKHLPMAYLGVARTVQNQALQNLLDIVAIGHSISSISRHRNDHVKDDSIEKKERINKHIDMYTDQKNRIETTLEQNRKLFDALSETAVEIANIQSFSKYDRIDTLARLAGLAEIASASGK